MKKKLFLAAVVLVNSGVAAGSAWALREYEVAKLPSGEPIIVCEYCILWGCDCP